MTATPSMLAQLRRIRRQRARRDLSAQAMWLLAMAGIAGLVWAMQDGDRPVYQWVAEPAPATGESAHD